MANAFQENSGGGISFSAPLFSFGNTTPAINSGYSFDIPMATIQAFQNRALEFSVQNSNANRGFLDNVMANSQAALADYNMTVLSKFGEINASVADTLKYTARQRAKAASGGCFVTTAVCSASGLPDDCDELQTLRGFRDGYMMESPARTLLVQLYYEVAPLIVRAIEARDDAPEILETLRTSYILPAVQAVKSGDNEHAFGLYVEMLRVAATFARGE